MMLGCDPEREDYELLEKVPFIYVSSAILVDEDDKILISTRPKGKEMSGLWEFPGGKIKQDEIPELALVRELKEELDIKTSASCMLPLNFVSYRYDKFHLIMYVFVCRKWKGVVTAKENQQFKWIKNNELSNYKMPDANMPLISAVRNL